MNVSSRRLKVLKGKNELRHYEPGRLGMLLPTPVLRSKPPA